MIQNTKTAIITGITGQDGCYLAQLLLKEGYAVVGITRNINAANLKGLLYLDILKHIKLLECDLLDLTQVINLISQWQPTEIYNLAAQSSVSASFKHPISTVTYNTTSVINLLEAIKLTNKSIRFYQASSSEMFGDVNVLPISEDAIFHPKSPYAISKATAHWLCVNYRESYDLFISCGILFNHESYLRANSFFLKKVLHNAILISKGKMDSLIVGNIEVKRDFGYAPLYVDAMYKILQTYVPDNFIVCSGASVTLRDLIYVIFDKLNISKDRIVVDQQLIRPSEIPDIYGNPIKTKQVLGWKYDLDHEDLIDLLLEEELRNWD